MPWVEQKAKEVFFDDPKDQARFVAMAVFGIDLSQAKGKKFRVKRGGSGKKD